MSPVTPKPAAEFSTLAMTKSSDSRSIEGGIARRAISRPGLPKMSPMNRMRMLANRDPDLARRGVRSMRGRTTRSSPVTRVAAAPPGIERALDAEGAREAAERAFGHVEAGVRRARTSPAASGR